MESSKKPQHADLVADALSHFLNQAVPSGATLLLGFSGGLDSCVLLDLLAAARSERSFQLHAMHVHHGISPHADEWAAFCAMRCQQYGVPLTIHRVEVARNAGQGLEAAAREARYAALNAYPADAIVLAHHLNDQAETLLLQLLRGAGVKGLAAMRGMRGVEAVHGHRLLRPLLEISRQTLQAYAQAHRLCWIEDESNADPRFDRNFIRLEIMPRLETRFSAASATLARSAAHLAEADALLDELAAQDAARWISDLKLDVAVFGALSPPRARHLLRHWLTLCGEAAPNTRRLHDIARQLHEAAPDAHIAIPLPTGDVHRYRGYAFHVPRRTAPLRPQTLQWQGEPGLQIADGVLRFSLATGAGIACRHLEQPFEIRPRQGGERLRPFLDGPSRPLRLLFQEHGTPPWLRDRLPLVYLYQRLACVPGIGVEGAFRAKTHETGVVITWDAPW